MDLQNYDPEQIVPGLTQYDIDFVRNHDEPYQLQALAIVFMSKLIWFPEAAADIGGGLETFLEVIEGMKGAKDLTSLDVGNIISTAKSHQEENEESNC